MDYAIYIAAVIVFAPALLLLYYTLKGYTYPAVEDPFFKDSTVFTIFAVGLIEGFVISAFYVKMDMSNIFIGVLFAAIQVLLILVVLNLKRFHRKSDTVFYGFSLGMGQGVGMAFGIAASLLSVFEEAADVDVYTWAVIVVITAQELLLMSSVGATVGEGVARLSLWEFTLQGLMVCTLAMIFWTFAVMGVESWYWIPMSVLSFAVSAYYFYKKIHLGLSSLVSEVLRIEGKKRKDVPR